MIVDKIDVSGDPRVEQRSADINGKQYGMYSCEEIDWHGEYTAMQNRAF